MGVPTHGADHRALRVRSVRRRGLPVHAVRRRGLPIRGTRRRRLPVPGTERRNRPVRAVRQRGLPVRAVPRRRLPVPTGRQLGLPVRTVRRRGLPVRGTRRRRPRVRGIRRRRPVRAVPRRRLPVPTGQRRRLPVHAVRRRGLPVRGTRGSRPLAWEGMPEGGPVVRRARGPGLFQGRQAARHVGRRGARAVQPPGDGGRVGPGVQRGTAVRHRRDAVGVRGAAEVVQQGVQEQRAARTGPYALLGPARGRVREGLADQPGRRRVAERGEGVGAHQGRRQRLGESGGPRVDVVLAALGGDQQYR
ncbi:hypothetical protein B0E38_07485 [Streptomyces sp. 111WW2]|nr:hypothetical protein B0E38_07485 [Streptomyces sp. 111WW2]